MIPGCVMPASTACCLLDVQVLPALGRTSSAASAAAAAGTADAASGSQQQAFTLDPSKTLVVEYQEPTTPRMASIPPDDAVPFWGNAATAGLRQNQLPASAAAMQPDGGPLVQQAEGGNFTQDLLLLYTPAALAYFSGSEVWLRATAESSVALANKAYVDSLIPVQLNLVGVRQVRRKFCSAAT
jgi:hypothetical protein